MYVFKFFDSKMLKPLAGLTPEEALLVYDSSGIHAPAIKNRLLDAVAGKVDNYYFEERVQTLESIKQDSVKKGQDLTTKEKLILSKSDYLSDRDISVMFPKLQSTFQKSTTPTYKLKNNILDFSDDSKNTITINSATEESRKANIFKSLTDNNPMLISCSSDYLTSCKEELSKFISYDNIDKIHIAQALVANCVYFYDLEFRIADSPKYLVTNRSPQKDLIIPKFSQENPRPLSSDEFCLAMIKKYRFNSDWKGELLKPSLKHIPRSIEIGEEYDSRHCSYDETSGVGSDCPFRSVFSHIYQMSYLNRINFNYLRNFFKFPIGTILVVEFVEYLCMKLGFSLLLVSNMTTTICFVSEEFAFIHHASAHYSRMNSTNQKPQYSSAIFRNISENYVPLSFLRKNNAHVDRFKSSLTLIKNSTWKLKTYEKEPETLKMYRTAINHISPFISEIKKLEAASILKEHLFSVQSFGVKYWDYTIRENSFIHFKWINLMNQLTSDSIRENIIFLDNLTNPDLNERISDNIPSPPNFETSRKLTPYTKSVSHDKWILNSSILRVKQLKMRIGTLFDRDPEKNLQTIRVLEYSIYSGLLSNCFSLIETGAYNKQLSDLYLNQPSKLFMSDEEIQNLVNVTNKFEAHLQDIDRSRILMGYVKKSRTKKAEYPHISLLRHFRLLYLEVLIELLKINLNKYEGKNKSNSAKNSFQEKDSEVIIKKVDIFDEYPPEELNYDIPVFSDAQDIINTYSFTESQVIQSHFFSNSSQKYKPHLSLFKFKIYSRTHCTKYQDYFMQLDSKIDSMRLDESLNVKRQRKLYLKTIPKYRLNEQLMLLLSDELKMFDDQKNEISFIEVIVNRLVPIFDTFSVMSDHEFNLISDVFTTLEKSELSKSIECSLLLLRTLLILTMRMFEIIVKSEDLNIDTLPLRGFLTGTILKMRVALVSNLFMSIFDKNQETDIMFSKYFPIESNRTPDYIFVDHEKKYCDIVETSYSSKRAKGIIAKGFSLTSSKYYEEICAIYDLGYSVRYYPIIFYDQMSLNEEDYFSNSVQNLPSKGQDVKSKEIRYGHKLFFNNFIQLRRLFADSYYSSRVPLHLEGMRITFEMNDLIYPKGRLLNMCFNSKMKPIENLSFKDDSKIIEYNYYLLLTLCPKIGIYPKSVIDHIFKSPFSSLNEEDLYLLKLNFRKSYFYSIEQLSIPGDDIDDNNRVSFKKIMSLFEYQYFNISDSLKLDYIRYKNYKEIHKFYFRLISFSNIQKHSLKHNLIPVIKPYKHYTNSSFSNKRYVNPSLISSKKWNEILKNNKDSLFSEKCKEELLKESERKLNSQRVKLDSFEDTLNTFTIISLCKSMKITQSLYKFTLPSNIKFIEYDENTSLFYLFTICYPLISLYVSKYQFKAVKNISNKYIHQEGLLSSTNERMNVTIFKHEIRILDFYLGSKLPDLLIKKADSGELIVTRENFNRENMPIHCIDLDFIKSYVKEFNDSFYIPSYDSLSDPCKSILQTIEIENIMVQESLEDSQSRYIKSVMSIKETLTKETEIIDINILFDFIDKKSKYMTDNMINDQGIEDNRTLTSLHYSYGLLPFDLITRSFFEEINMNEKILNIIDKSIKNPTNEKRVGPFTIISGKIYRKCLGEVNKSIEYQYDQVKDKLVLEMRHYQYKVKENGLLDHVNNKCIKAHEDKIKFKEYVNKTKEFTKFYSKDRFIKCNLQDVNQYEHYLTYISDEKNLSFPEYEFVTMYSKISHIVPNEGDNHFREFYDNVLCNPFIYSAYQESVLFFSLSTKSLFKTKNTNYKIIDEGLKNKYAIQLPSSNSTRVRYVLLSQGQPSVFSKYKNYDRTNDLCMTNVYSETTDRLFYKHQLFYTLLQQSFVLFNMGVSHLEIKKFFLLNYENLSMFTKTTKLIVSIFKYLNVIQFSDYSRVGDLIKKYVINDDFTYYTSLSQVLFSKKILTIFNTNLQLLQSYTKDDKGSFKEIRNKLNTMKINFLSMAGPVNRIDKFITINAFYTYVYKDTTQININYVNFLKTIIKNNNETNKFVNNEQKNNDNRFFDDKLDQRPCFFDKNIIDHSMKFMKDYLVNLKGDEVKGVSLSKEILDNFKSDIYDDFSDLFLSARKSLKFKIEHMKIVEFERSKKDKSKIKKGNKSQDDNNTNKEKTTVTIYDERKNPSREVQKDSKSTNLSDDTNKKTFKIPDNIPMKQTVMDSTLEMMKEIAEGLSSEIDPLIIFNKFFTHLTTLNFNQIKKMSTYLNLACNSKKSQHEDDREIYVVHIYMKMLLFVIQSFFRTINKKIPQEAVVQSVATKLKEIKEMTSKIMSNSNADYEIIFCNGDMASWSGTDIYQKFSFITDRLKKHFEIDSDICNLILLCLKLTSKMKVLIPNSIVIPDLLKECKTFRDENGHDTDMKYIELEDSWGQGLYHNISSFVHTLELIWRKECLFKFVIDFQAEETAKMNNILVMENMKKSKEEFDDMYKIRNSLIKDRSQCESLLDENKIIKFTDFAISILNDMNMTGYESHEYVKNNLEPSLNLLEKSMKYEKKTIILLRFFFKNYTTKRLFYLMNEDKFNEFFTNFENKNLLLENMKYSEENHQIQIVINSTKGFFKFLRQLEQISHSDDKNEIYAASLKVYEFIVKMSDYGPLYFALKPSKTKNSFSRLTSEMVGQQNIQGYLFDNPIKVINKAMNTLTEPDFINNNKSIISRYRDFFRKSSNEIVCSVLYRLSYSLLTLRYGLRNLDDFQLKKFVLLPVDFGGILISRFSSIVRYGNYADLYSKDIYYKYMNSGYDFNILYEQKRKLKRFFMKKSHDKLKNFIRRFCPSVELHTLKGIDLYSINSKLMSIDYIENTIKVIAKQRKEMFVDHSDKFNLLNLLHHKKLKYRLSGIEDIATQDFYTNIIFNTSFYSPNYNAINLDLSVFNMSSKIINDIAKYENIAITEERRENLSSYSDNFSSFFSTEQFTIMKISCEFILNILDYNSFYTIASGNYKEFFNDYRNSRKYESIIDRYNCMIKFFGIDSYEKMMKLRGNIDLYFDFQLMKRDYIYFNKDLHCQDQFYETKIIEKRYLSTFDSHTKNSFDYYIQSRKEIFSNNYDSFKKYMNSYLIDFDYSYLLSIRSEIFDSLRDIDLLKHFKRFFSSDKNVKYLYYFFEQTEILKTLEFDRTLRGPYKFELIGKDEISKISVYIIKKKRVIVDFLVLFDKLYFFNFYVKLNSDNYHLLRSLSKVNKTNMSIDILKRSIQIINENGYNLSYTSSSKSTHEILYSLTINPTYTSVVQPKIDLGKVFVREKDKFFNYHFKPYMEYITMIVEKRSYLKIENRMIKYIPRTDKNSLEKFHFPQFRHPIRITIPEIRRHGYEFRDALLRFRQPNEETRKYIMSALILEVHPGSLLDKLDEPYIFMFKFYNAKTPFSQNIDDFNQYFIDNLSSEKKLILSSFNSPEIFCTDEYLLTELSPIKVLSNRYTNYNEMKLIVNMSINPKLLLNFMRNLYIIISRMNEDEEYMNTINLQDKKIIVSFYSSMMTIIYNSGMFYNIPYELVDLNFNNLMTSILSRLKVGSNYMRTSCPEIDICFEHIEVVSELYRVEQSSFDFNNQVFMESDSQFFSDSNHKKEAVINKSIEEKEEQIETMQDAVKSSFELRKKNENLEREMRQKNIIIKNQEEKINNTKELEQENKDLSQKLRETESQLKKEKIKSEQNENLLSVIRTDSELVKNDLSRQGNILKELEKNLKDKNLESKMKSEILKTHIEIMQKEIDSIKRQSQIAIDKNKLITESEEDRQDKEKILQKSKNLNNYDNDLITHLLKIITKLKKQMRSLIDEISRLKEELSNRPLPSQSVSNLYVTTDEDIEKMKDYLFKPFLDFANYDNIKSILITDYNYRLGIDDNDFLYYRECFVDNSGILSYDDFEIIKLRFVDYIMSSDSFYSYKLQKSKLPATQYRKEEQLVQEMSNIYTLSRKVFLQNYIEIDTFTQSKHEENLHKILQIKNKIINSKLLSDLSENEVQSMIEEKRFRRPLKLFRRGHRLEFSKNRSETSHLKEFISSSKCDEIFHNPYMTISYERTVKKRQEQEKIEKEKEDKERLQKELDNNRKKTPKELLEEKKQAMLAKFFKKS
jgi:hypothetical protein